METSESYGITLKFLETFLPPWDSIKSFKVTPTAKQEIKTIILQDFLKITKLHVKVIFDKPKKKGLNLIIKTPCPQSLGALRRFKTFEKEIFFHDQFLTELKGLVNNCDISDSFLKATLKLNTEPFVAASICNITQDPLENFIATSDLGLTRGFRHSKVAPLDFVHCQVVIKELAKLHALSWCYKKSMAVLYLQKLYPLIQETFINERNKEDLEFIINGLDIDQLVQHTYGHDSQEAQVVGKVIKSGTDIPQLFINYLNYQGLHERDIENQVLTTLPESDDDFVEESWAVGSHGDLTRWNVMFKYDSKNGQEPLEVALLNFHSFRECCPTMDLAYFLYTSTDTFTRASHTDTLLQVYHDKFIGICGLLKKEAYPGFNVNSLRRRFNRAKLFGLLSSIFIGRVEDEVRSKSVEDEVNEVKCKIVEDEGPEAPQLFSDILGMERKEDGNFECLQRRLSTEISNSDNNQFGLQRTF